LTMACEFPDSHLSRAGPAGRKGQGDSKKPRDGWQFSGTFGLEADFASTICVSPIRRRARHNSPARQGRGWRVGLMAGPIKRARPRAIFQRGRGILCTRCGECGQAPKVTVSIVRGKGKNACGFPHTVENSHVDCVLPRPQTQVTPAEIWLPGAVGLTPGFPPPIRSQQNTGQCGSRLQIARSFRRAGAAKAHCRRAPGTSTGTNSSKTRPLADLTALALSSRCFVSARGVPFAISSAQGNRRATGLTTGRWRRGARVCLADARVMMDNRKRLGARASLLSGAFWETSAPILIRRKTHDWPLLAMPKQLIQAARDTVGDCWGYRTRGAALLTPEARPCTKKRARGPTVCRARSRRRIRAGAWRPAGDFRFLG